MEVLVDVLDAAFRTSLAVAGSLYKKRFASKVSNPLLASLKAPYSVSEELLFIHSFNLANSSFQFFSSSGPIRPEVSAHCPVSKP